MGGVHHLQGAPIGAECPRSDRPLILFCQAPSLLIHSLISLHCALVHPVQRPTRHHNVAQKAPWVGEVAIFQYHHGVLDVPVSEVHPHGRPHFRPDTTPLDWAGPWSYLRMKHHPECPGIVTPTFLIALPSQPPFCHAVLHLVVCHHQPLCQVLLEICTEHPIPLNLLVTWYLPRHPPHVGFVYLHLGRPA